jgi:secondary thiamine-phosphate synthase enzyme
MNPTQQHRQRTHYKVLHLRTERTTEFRDITPEVQEVVDHAGIRTGFVKIQSMHTTAGILLNEHEPMLLNDMKRMMDRISPAEAYYAHDDLDVRTVNLTPEEREHGYSHCPAMFLRSTEMLNVIGGRLQLGRW